jgi:hypothetical protein
MIANWKQNIRESLEQDGEVIFGEAIGAYGARWGVNLLKVAYPDCKEISVCNEKIADINGTGEGARVFSAATFWVPSLGHVAITNRGIYAGEIDS